jgi:hypothetical protein
MNHLDLSQPHIKCSIEHDGTLPSGAYPIIATLAEALETANAELDEWFNPEE